MFYEPVLTNRWFKPGVRYSEIDWTDLSTVVTEFDSRIREWYIEPARSLQQASGNFAFPVMALACMLIDTLSQFHYGEERSTGNMFVRFVKKGLPQLNEPISPAIERPKDSQGPKEISNTAQALYHGFRCGILHEAHVTTYGAISGLDRIVLVERSGITRYQDGRSCPTVIFDPHRVLEEVDLFFQRYTRNLRNKGSAHDALRRAFKKKFALSFGIDITGAT